MKKAIPKEDCRPPGHSPMASTPTKKVFLGGLPLEATKDRITECLASYGPLSSVQIMTAKETEKPRGFGFATFEEFDDAKKLCAMKYIKIDVS